MFLTVCFCEQGFICPQCMKSHNSAEELFKHYELFHDTGELPAHVAPTRCDKCLWMQIISTVTAFIDKYIYYIHDFCFLQGRPYDATTRSSGPARFSQGKVLVLLPVKRGEKETNCVSTY